MQNPEDDRVEAAFDAELLRLASAAHDAFAVEGTPGDPGGLSLHARTPDGFPIVVERSAAVVEIRLGPWTHRQSLGEADEADEVLDAALDLVAAAMWGRVILHETEAGGRPWRYTVSFLGRDGPREIASGGGSVFGWRPRTRARLRKNEGRPPEGTIMGEGGALPSRPWIGVRQTEAAQGPAALPLHGELDLHPFSPRDVASLVREYIAACRDAGVLHLRIVHGKGKGQLRRTVHAILSRHEAVASFRLGGHGEGSWGATMVVLHPPSK